METELSKLNDIKKNIKEMGLHFDREALLKELEELDLKMQEKDFWQDIKRAEEVLKKVRELKIK